MRLIVPISVIWEPDNIKIKPSPVHLYLRIELDTMKNFVVLLSTTLFMHFVQNAEILVVAPFPAYSHFAIPFRLAKELVNRGHQVTCINPYPQKQPIENYTDIFVGELIPVVEEIRKTLLDNEKTSLLEKLKNTFEFLTILEVAFTSEGVQKLLKSDKKFDVIIIEDLFTEAFIGLSHRFKAPAILISATPSSARTNYIFANPAPLSYVPNPQGKLTSHMNFWQRIENLLLTKIFECLLHLVYLPQQRKLFNKYISNDTDLDTYIYNTSLSLTNSHASVSDAVPHVPSIIEVGGFHVNPPKRLPEELQKFLDDTNDGVVLFSMGSNLKSKDLKQKVLDGILKAFSKIKQKVLWKFETDLPNAPKNVKVMQWLPQQDILAHPNIIAFITHVGFLSTVEAVYHGVPIIGIPVFADQMHNVATAVKNGYAVTVPLDHLSEETLSWALSEILTNPRYRNEAKRRSRLMHDQPLKPMDLAVYWVEHVIRHQGAPHLRSSGLDLRWYQREMIDVIGFLVLVFVVILLIVFVVIRKIATCIAKTVRNKPRVHKSKKSQ